MDQKTRVLGKRSPNKSNAVNGEAEMYIKGTKEEVSYGKQVALEETVKNLHEQVACLLCECNAKDRLMAEHAKAAQEANSGRERAEALAAIQKQQLENVLQQKVAAIKRLIHINAALKNCKRELSSNKIYQDQKATLEKSHKKLESKYVEAKKKLANLAVENARLTKSLVNKEQIIKDVNSQISKAREFKIKSRHAVMTNKQQLETERQKLRLLVKKRAPRNHSKGVDRRMSLVIKQLSEVEEENQMLKESASKREIEIQNLKAELNNGNSAVNEMSDHFENLKLINYDLDQQLSAAKVELKEAVHNISFLEMELEDKNHHCNGLEATCLELQLQLSSVSGKDVVTKDLEEEEEKMLQNGKKITEELTDNKLTRHSSLNDLMAADTGVDWEVVLNPPRIKEIITATETEEPYILVPRALSIVPVKNRGKRAGLLKSLLFRGKKGGNRKKLLCFAAYKV
ncbi:filament-like plant protein 4 isoform X2 [Bidens hawaiensis]|uniref:filament-like plant protein 4 isoform X2 n=1 Tax=Bidens hawaiensis TaxID=980011 RepID=UPI00404B9BC0